MNLQFTHGNRMLSFNVELSLFPEKVFGCQVHVLPSKEWLTLSSDIQQS